MHTYGGQRTTSCMSPLLSTRFWARVIYCCACQALWLMSLWGIFLFLSPILLQEHQECATMDTGDPNSSPDTSFVCSTYQIIHPPTRPSIHPSIHPGWTWRSVCRSENNLRQWICSFFCVGPEDQTQVIRLGGGYPDQLSSSLSYKNCGVQQ